MPAMMHSTRCGASLARSYTVGSNTHSRISPPMLAATFLAVFFVPLFYKVVVEKRLTEKRSHDELLDEVKHLRVVSHHMPQTPGHPPIARRGEDHV